jgi:site-specific DNA-cytosine methylase
MTNSDKIILDLCGGTGAWSKPYRDAGYDVRLVTLPDQDVFTYAPPDGVYGILAAPPCTEFSLAKNGSPTPRNLSAGLDVVRACLKIIWECSIDNRLKFWAMENPTDMLRHFLGRPRFSYRQWEFGDWGIKPTDIWGFFNEPRKTVSERPGGLQYRYKTTGKVNTMAWASRAQLRRRTGCTDTRLSRADLRAITPPGFSRAFFRANR